MDAGTLHHSNRPRKSPVLEVPQKTKPPNSPMACRTPRLPFCSPTHPGSMHTVADALSRPPGADEGKEDNQEITMILEPTFVQVMDEDSPGTLEDQIVKTQNHYRQAMTTLQEQGLIYPSNASSGTFWKDTTQNRLIIPKDEELRRQVVDTWHNNPTGGHPRRDETARQINERYFWPGARTWISEYVKGCATCQQNKNLVHRFKASLYRIPVPTRPEPFK